MLVAADRHVVVGRLDDLQTLLSAGHPQLGRGRLAGLVAALVHLLPQLLHLLLHVLLHLVELLLELLGVDALPTGRGVAGHRLEVLEQIHPRPDVGLPGPGRGHQPTGAHLQLRGPLDQIHGVVAGFAVPPDLERHPLARGVGGDQAAELLGVDQALVVELQQHIAGLQPGGLGGRAGVDLADHQGRRSQRHAFGGRGFGDRHAQERRGRLDLDAGFAGRALGRGLLLLLHLGVHRGRRPSDGGGRDRPRHCGFQFHLERLLNRV